MRDFQRERPLINTPFSACRCPQLCSQQMKGNDMARDQAQGPIPFLLAAKPRQGRHIYSLDQHIFSFCFSAARHRALLELGFQKDGGECGKPGLRAAEKQKEDRVGVRVLQT